ncbi:MAG: hypothetical protein ISS11_04645 [Candidatus Marinimicrobia bacterium]|nr:hypothetical protein [Candidatus Neomarinimicrobiota bacterium]
MKNNKIILFLIIILSVGFSQPKIVIKSPKKNQTIKAYSTTEIKWKSKGSTSSFVYIYYSDDGGIYWEEVIFTQNDGSYVWEVPNVNSTECLVKIVDYSDESIFGISKEYFSILGSVFELTSPNGGEILQSGAKQQISWISENINTRLVKIYLSVDNASHLSVIHRGAENKGSFLWTVPNFSQAQQTCLLKIESYDNATTFDITDESFRIVPITPEITIIFPNGSELLEADNIYTIKWDAQNLESKMLRIYYSINAGTSWERISFGSEIFGQFEWMTPTIDSDHCLIKIEDSRNKNINAISENQFAITTKPQIDIVNEIRGNVFETGDSFTINWKTYNLKNSSVNLYFTLDEGKTWNPIEFGISDVNSYLWYIPEVDETKYASKIKIESSSNSSVFGISKFVFTIKERPSISLTYPIGGELLSSGYKTNIRWENKNLKKNTVNLSYSVDGKKNWKIIANDVPGIGLYDWEIPEVLSENCHIKISSTENTEISDVSDLPFTITTSPLIYVNTPNKGDIWDAGETYRVKWDSYNLESNMVNILYSINVESDWELLVSKIDDTGRIEIQLPKIKQTSDKFRIKIEDSEDETVFNVSEKFKLVGFPYLEIIQPTNNAEFEIYSFIDIRWKSENFDSGILNLYFSANGGQNFSIIETDYPNNGIYRWTIPWINKTASNCILKIVSKNQTEIYAVSEKFTIIVPKGEISIISPDKDFVLRSTEFLKIRWVSSNLKRAVVDLYYSSNGSDIWESISKNETDDGEYLWMINTPKQTLKKCRVRIVESRNPEIFGMSQQFTILGKPTIKFKNENLQNEIIAGSVIPIEWETVNHKDYGVNVYFSSDKGIIWEEVVSNNQDSIFNWIIPKYTKEKQCKFKIESAEYIGISDMSVEFQIKPLKVEEIIREPIEVQSIITIIAPNGGERWTAKKANTIQWNASDVRKNQVNLYYSFDNEENWILIASRVANVGSYIWQLPEIYKESSAKIKVESTQNFDVFGISQNSFTILKSK